MFERVDDPFNAGYERQYGLGVLNPDGNITTLKEVENVTLDSCEDECSKVPDCLAYTYISTAQHCDLKDESDIGGGFTERKDLVSGRKLSGDQILLCLTVMGACQRKDWVSSDLHETRGSRAGRPMKTYTPAEYVFVAVSAWDTGEQ